MANGYTRQSTVQIVDNLVIYAAGHNNEYNQIQSAFSGSTGHDHSGGTGLGPKINLTSSTPGVVGALDAQFGGTFVTTAGPAVTDDTPDYVPGSKWVNTSTPAYYVCVSNSTGAAVWKQIVLSGVAVPGAFTTLTASGAVSGAGFDAYLASPPAIGATAPSTGKFTTVNISGQLTSTVATSTAPFVIASTTAVANLNSSLLLDKTWAVPGTIGSTTPSTGAFTTISASGVITSTVSTGTAPFTVASTTTVANLSSSTLLGSTWANPAAIGSGTPAAGTFTTLADSVGGVRFILQSGSDKTTSYSLAQSDNGQTVAVGASGSITVPNSTLTAGTAIALYNDTGSTATITTNTTTAFIAGSTTAKGGGGTMTLAARGMATVWFYSTTHCVVSGNVT